MNLNILKLFGALDIKLISKRSKINKANILFSFLIGCLIFILIYGTNRYDINGNLVPIYKFFTLIILIFTFIVIIFCICSLLNYFGNKKKIEAAEEISNNINEFMFSSEDDSDIFPTRYTKVEAQLLKVKNKINQQQTIFNLEMQKKNELITYLAHDLKTPLASVIGYLNLLQEVQELSEVQRSKYIEITLDKAYRLEQLINEFFEISRYNLYSITLEKTTFNLSMMLEQIVDEIFPILEEKSQKIDSNIPSDVMLLGDSNKLARVFNNILKNASSYGDRNSFIVLKLYEDEKKVVVSICNNGIHIKSCDINKIFEKFYRADDSRSSKTGGSGLGLAIAKQIVEEHDGVITAKSKGNLTIFTVTLPKELC